MVSLRVGRCYRKITRAYTRKSKVKSKSYIKAVPQSKIVRYDMGDNKKDFEFKVNLISNQSIQLRHNAVESARLVINRRLQSKLGPKGFFMKIKPYPHHILRENKMLSGARADRLQTGMSHSFGKAMGLAAQVKKGKTVFSISVDKIGLDIAKEAIKTARPRLPGKFSVVIEKNS
ncbi:50S ribosomal protein L16 [archaeon]|nr:50S ribosomal protein L16 [archaeon]